MKIIYKNWFVHNVFAHPLMYFAGYVSIDFSRKIHDSTLPAKES